MFANHGRGIGQRGRDNGVLVVLAVKDRRVRLEVGYDLEQFLTDGFAGETSRQYMAPEFARGAYGAGLLAGVSRVVERVATGRNVTLPGVRPVVRRRSAPLEGRSVFVALFVFLMAGAAASDRSAAGVVDSAAGSAGSEAGGSADSAAAAAVAAAAGPGGSAG